MKILMTVIFVFAFSLAAFGQQKDSAGEKNRGIVSKIKEKVKETVKDVFGNEPKKVKVKDYSKKYKNLWLPYFTGISFKYLYNAAKAYRKGQMVEIWTQQVDMADDEVIELTKYEIDCAGGKLRPVATTVYYTYAVQSNGKAERSKTAATSQKRLNEPFKEIRYASSPAALFEIACSL